MVEAAITIPQISINKKTHFQRFYHYGAASEELIAKRKKVRTEKKQTKIFWIYDRWHTTLLKFHLKEFKYLNKISMSCWGSTTSLPYWSKTRNIFQIKRVNEIEYLKKSFFLVWFHKNGHSQTHVQHFWCDH